MSDRSAYKAAKIAFVSDNEGDTVTRINTVCLTAISTFVLWRILFPRLPFCGTSDLRIPIIEFVILIVPLLLALTLCANIQLWLNSIICAGSVTSYALLPLKTNVGSLQEDPRPASKRKVSRSPLPRTSQEGYFAVDNGKANEKNTPNQASGGSPPLLSIRDLHRPYVTVWRAHMMVMTIISILAIDFPVFPRTFGKCESWGTSLMDLGVGSFVFSLGVTSAIPVLQRYGHATTSASIGNIFGRTRTVLALGVLRLLTVKGTDYPEHVTEYGVHWNFFFTLGALPMFGLIAERFMHVVSFRNAGMLCTAGHQLLLIVTPLQEWVFGPDRSNLVSANKEGLVSMLGYVAIYLLGCHTGTYALPPDPAWLDRKVVAPYKARVKTAFGCIHYLAPEQFAVSRRLANTAYVLWIAAFNVTFMFLYLAVDATLSERGHAERLGAPMIFVSINKNSMIIFLSANVLTGLINFSTDSVHTTNLNAFLILLLYTATLVAIAHGLRNRRLKL